MRTYNVMFEELNNFTQEEIEILKENCMILRTDYNTTEISAKDIIQAYIQQEKFEKAYKVLNRVLGQENINKIMTQNVDMVVLT